MKSSSPAQTSTAPHSNEQVLIVGPSWVGDMVMAQSLFIVLKDQHPDRLIDVLAPAWSRPLLERMPQVNQAIDMPLGHGHFALEKRRTLGHQLRAQYQQSIALPNSWKSGLIPWFANIPVRTGWRGEARYVLLNDRRILDKKQLPYMVQRFVSLAFEKNADQPALDDCPAPRLVANQQQVPELLRRFELNTEVPVAILCPGAEFGPAKQWPAEHFSATAAALINTGWQVWIMGSRGDKAIANTIANQVDLPAHHNLCGKTTLEEAIDLMSCAHQVISNDSGLMHIASALNKPVIALYGATSPNFTPPLSPTAKTLSIPVDCGPCFKRQCPLGHHRCMSELYPDRVLELVTTTSYTS
jgi:heptosyltransferase-2